MAQHYILFVMNAFGMAGCAGIAKNNIRKARNAEGDATMALHYRLFAISMLMFGFIDLIATVVSVTQMCVM